MKKHLIRFVILTMTVFVSFYLLPFKSYAREKDPLEPTEFRYPYIYADDTMTITVDKEWHLDTWVYTAHVKTTDYTRISVYNTQDAETNAKDIATLTNAILCVAKCDTYSAKQDSSQIWQTEELCKDKTATLRNGQLYVPQTGVKHPQICLGTNGKPGDFWVCVAEGDLLDGVSVGFNQYECAEFLRWKGCIYGKTIVANEACPIIFLGQILNHIESEPAIFSYLVVQSPTA